MFKVAAKKMDNCGDLIEVSGFAFSTAAFNSDVVYMAPAPASKTLSFFGNGFPFPSQEIAYSNCSRGILNNGVFTIVIPTPNSYYHNGELFGPEISIIYTKNNVLEIQRIPLNIPSHSYRFHTYPKLRDTLGPLFYDNIHSLPVRSQYQITQDSSYTPNHYYDNHWGNKPSV